MNKTLAILATTLCTLAAHAADLHFPLAQGESQTLDYQGQSVAFRAFEGLVYVQKPVDRDHQRMNVYIPEAYFHGETLGGFTADTAPIFLPNTIGGYMPAQPGTPTDEKRGGGDNAILVALSKGYVVASPGARGRTQAQGKAPAAIVDLKAAVRYLHFNDAAMPGDARKIISNGTSAGGALSALLGASGDHDDYAALLADIGAADASDAIFAVSAYCPITNLEHADAAYEWQFNGVNDYEKIQINQLDHNVKRKLIQGTLTADEQAVSAALKARFPAYLNSLNLKNKRGETLTLDDHGNGTFKDHIAALLAASATQALQDGADPVAMHARGWLQLDGNFAGNHVARVDVDAYAQAVGRQKTPPAFDALDLSSGENQLFGDTQHDTRHFTDFAAQQRPDAPRADAQTVRLMNAMAYADTAPAEHWRIRVGTLDRDTSLAISAILALTLENAGKSVDYALAWDVPHSGDYDLDALFAWMEKISK